MHRLIFLFRSFYHRNSSECNRILWFAEVMRVKFAVVGGDRRSVLLCSMLARDGHRVQSFALEKAELPGEIPKAGCLQSCVYGADCVVLPVPSERGGFLNAPYAASPCRMDELIGALWRGQLVCGGKLSEESRLAAGLHPEDIMQRQEFTVGNAALTAEGAVGLLIQNSERSLLGSRVLVCGWGRIGRILTLRLKSLGAEVTAAARSPADRALARAMSCRALDYSQLEGELDGFDFVVNTVPARVLTDAMLCCLSEGALLLELASPPGGFDRTLAENIGVKVLAAPGLPGKSAPYSAAALIRDAVYQIIREQEE